MCLLQFIARLQKIQEREKVLFNKERALSRASIKYIISLNKLEEAIKSNSIPAVDKRRLRSLEELNRQLRNLKQTEKAGLEKCKQENLRLKEEFQLRIEQTLDEERKWSSYREKLHLLKQLSNIHINTKALPQYVQGMVICERSQSRSWIPFKISTDGVDDKHQISDKLWNLTQHTDDYNMQWEELICGTSLSTE